MWRDRGLFSGVTHAQSQRGVAPEFPNFAVLLYIWTQNDCVRQGNTRWGQACFMWSVIPRGGSQRSTVILEVPL